MSDRDSFLRAICERPDDDGPRLVFADWLDEQGEPLGELIRVQCRLAELPESSPDRRPLGDREYELFRDHGAEWEREFFARLTHSERPTVYVHHRGFVESVTYAAVRPLLAEGENLYAAAPVQKVVLSACEDADRLAEWAGLRRLRTLVLDHTLRDPRRAQVVLASPHLAGLKRLDLRGASFSPEAAATLARNPALARLEMLDLRHCLASDDLAEALADAPFPPHLRTLDLGTNQIGPVGARALAASAQLSTVAVLDLHNNPIQDAGAQALLDSPHLESLTQLEVWGCPMSPVMGRRLRQRFGDRVVLE